MRIIRLSYGIRGFVRLYRYGIRLRRMITKKAQHKQKVIAFWRNYGIKATIDAFDVKRRTLFEWKKQLKLGQGNPETLNERSRRPKTVRHRVWPQVVVEEIKRIRTEHPNLGKDKIYLFLIRFCKEKQLNCPSVATIGNLIKDHGGMRTFPVKVRHNGQIVPRKRAKKDRKPKKFVALYPGHCGSFDTIERIIHGSRRYILTFTDVYSRFSYAWATTSHASQAAKEFFDLVTFVFPFPLSHILTDNGSEFMKHFDTEIKRLHKIHWHTYPKTPKMNAHDERFNRSLQEEFVDYHEPDLIDPMMFNKELMRHLLWHNTERPHWGLKLKTPLEFIQTNFPKECNMYLTDTRA